MPNPLLPTLILGESLVDIVTDHHGTRHVHPGGSPANVALGLARLGHLVHFATRVGDDDHGDLILNHLTRNGVLFTDGVVDTGPTSTATVTLDPQGRADYTFDITWDLPGATAHQIWRRLPPYAHLHTGSIAALLAPGAASVLDTVRAMRSSATISYDPNLRPALIGDPLDERPNVEALVAESDVVKVSDEDLDWLYPGVDPDKACEAWTSLGPTLVVLTRGAAGARAFWRNGTCDIAAIPVDVADTIGAGDAFMAGLIGGLLTTGLLGDPDDDLFHPSGRFELLAATSTGNLSPQITAALLLATHAAAVTCQRPGAHAPAPDELPAYLAHLDRSLWPLPSLAYLRR